MQVRDLSHFSFRQSSLLQLVFPLPPPLPVEIVAPPPPLESNVVSTLFFFSIGFSLPWMVTTQFKADSILGAPLHSSFADSSSPTNALKRQQPSECADFLFFSSLTAAAGMSPFLISYASRDGKEKGPPFCHSPSSLFFFFFFFVLAVLLIFFLFFFFFF